MGRPNINTNVKLQDFCTKLPADLLHRLRLESRRSGQTIRVILATELDRFLPADVEFKAIRKAQAQAE